MPPISELWSRIAQAIVDPPEGVDGDAEDDETEPNIDLLLSRLERDEAQEVARRLRAAELLNRQFVSVRIDEADLPAPLRKLT